MSTNEDIASIPQFASIPRVADDQILTIDQWALLNGISRDTAMRIIKRGNGPVVTQLSTRRIGVSGEADRAWKRSRARSPAA